jgi:nitrogen fixation protein FixH
MLTISNPAWKHFPRYMILAMGVVVAVNIRFIYVAVKTFPGAATADDFDTSNRYDKIMQAAAAQDALGWQENVTAQARHVSIDLQGPGHGALPGAQISMQAQRPLGNMAAVPLDARELAPGHFVSVQALPQPGQWDVVLRVSHGGHTAHVTRRVIIK